jgi:hypothetical protein
MILRTRSNSTVLDIHQNKLLTWTEKLANKEPTLETILKVLNISIPWQIMRVCLDPKFPSDLIQMEKQMIPDRFSVPVIFSNTDTVTVDAFKTWIDVEKNTGTMLEWEFIKSIESSRNYCQGILILLSTYPRPDWVCELQEDPSILAIVNIAPEIEFSGYSLDISVKDFVPVEFNLPQPSIIPKNDKGRDYIHSASIIH